MDKMDKWERIPGRAIIVSAVLILAAGLGPAWAASKHTVVEGEHLWALAKRYYGNPHRWRAIASANVDGVKDPHWIYPGQVLLIPDLPGSEPEETEASLPVAAAPAPAEPAAAPLPTEPSKPVEQAPPPPPSPPPAPDDLSVDMPPTLRGQYVGASRLKVARDWREDGRVAEFEGREMMVAQGDSINAKMSGKTQVSPGERFSVFRRDAPVESDEDKRAIYLQKVGVVEAKERVGKSVYRFVILKSVDSLQLGDVLKREVP